MDRHAFVNALKIMRAIDFDELTAAGVLSKSECWRAFRNDPALWLVRADDERADRLWTLVEARMGAVAEDGGRLRYTRPPEVPDFTTSGAALAGAAKAVR